MRHVPTNNTRLTLCAVLLACSGSAVLSQSSLQQAMLRSPALPVVADNDAVTTPPTSVAGALQQLAQQAGVIFTGSVSTVTPDAGNGARVTFAVEQGVRGVAAGADYSIRVSAWAGGAGRYFPGERALFLLTAPSAAGYSAPALGERGVVPLSGDALVGNLDLRWIAADVERSQPAARPDPAVSASVRPVSVSTDAAAPNWSSSAAEGVAGSSGEVTSNAGLPDVHAIDRDLLLDLLRTGNAALGQAR